MQININNNSSFQENKDHKKDNVPIEINPYGNKKKKHKSQKEKKDKDSKKKLKKNSNPKQEKPEDKPLKIEPLNIQKTQDPTPVSKIKKERKQKKAKKQKKPLNPSLKLILISIMILMSLTAIISNFKYEISEYIQSVKDNSYFADPNMINMPELTGENAQVAMEKLRGLGLSYNIKYMYNKYFEDNTVIKCSIDANNPVKKGETIIIYICKDESLPDVPKGVDFFKNVKLPKCPVSKNSITLTSTKINDVNLNFTLKNNTYHTISTIKITFGLFDKNNEKFANRTYTISSLELKPKEVIDYSIELENPNIAKISLEYISYKEYIYK